MDITEREGALRDSESRLRAVITNAPVVLFTLDNRGVITLSEGKGLEALGLVPKEVVGKSVFDLYRDRPEFLEKARRALAGEPINATIELAGAVFEIRSSSLRAENGEVAGVIGVAIDVTERKRIVQRLKETEARYRTLVEHVPAVTYVQEATGSNAVTYVSPQIEPMLGYKPEECISDPEHWIKILHPADRERVFAEDKRTNETSEPFGIEYRQFAKDGRVVWVRDEAVLVHDEEGNPGYWLGVQHDITERKRAEEALKESELRLRTVITNVPVVLFALDRKGVFTLSEGRGLDVLGLEPGEAVGRSVSELYGDRPAILEDIDRALAGEEFSAVSEVDSRTFETWYSPLRTRTGEVLGVIGVATDVTERKRAEEALAAERNLLRTLIDNLPDYVFVKDRESRFVLNNAEHLRVLGAAEQSEVVGKTDFDIFPVELAEHYYADEQELVRTGQPLIGREEPVRDEAGNRRWLSTTKVPLRDGAGEVIGLVGMSRDITERKRAERMQLRLARQAELRADTSAALADSGALEGMLQRCAEALVRHLDAAFARIWTLNEAENLLELQASAGLYTHLDGPHSRVPVGDLKIGLIAQERQPHLTNDVLDDPRVNDKEWARREGMVAFAGYPLLVHDRLVGVMAIFAREELAEDVIEALGSVADIVAQGIERKRVEEALYRSEERFRSLVQNASDIITLLGADGTVRYVSPAIEQVLGYRPEERWGRSTFELIHPDDVARARAAFAENLRSSGSTISIELRMRHRDGSWRHVEVTGTNLLDDPSVNGVVINSRDITERKRAEEEQKEVNRRLEDLAVLRADFSAMVAHELDTPLAVIRGYADMLATGELDPAGRDRALAKIQTETDVMAALIADARHAAAIEREDFAVKPREVPIAALIRDAVAYAETLCGTHQLIIENAAEERVWADPYRIGQVLRNLLSNAAKYSPGAAQIELRTVPGGTPEHIRIEVADHGVGVHPDDVNRIFEKFGRGRDRSGRKVAGVGLGLYLSRRILQAHGSDLTLDPAPGGGSVFGFELETVR